MWHCSNRGIQRVWWTSSPGPNLGGNKCGDFSFLPVWRFLDLDLELILARVVIFLFSAGLVFS